MIRLFLLFSLATGLLFPANAQSNVLSEMRLLSSFDKLVAANGINVTLRKSDSEKVKISVSNGLLSDVVSDISRGILTLKMRPKINKELSVMVVVYYKTLHSISAIRGASITSSTIITNDKMSLKATMGGEVKADTECTEILANAGSGGAIFLNGHVNRLEINANTKGKVRAGNLKAETAIVKATTGAEVEVNPEKYLEAIAISAGVIYYTDQPEKKTEKTSSGGEVRSRSSRPKEATSPTRQTDL